MSLTIELYSYSFWLFFIAGGFGLIIGSFLNVLIYRFHTGKSLAGHSHCLSCGTSLRWYELFPLFSYLMLRGRCSTCGCRIPSRYFLVELATGVLFSASLYHLLSVTSQLKPFPSSYSIDIVLLLLLWVVAAVLVVITVYDLYHFIIPDAFTVALTVVASVMIGYQFFLGSLTSEEILWQVGASLLGAAFLLLLWLISKGQWLGFGDVKLAIPLGLLVGTEQVFSLIVLSFWLGAAISLLIIAWGYVKRGKAGLQKSGQTLTMKSAVPFAPFMVASAILVLFLQFNVLSLFST